MSGFKFNFTQATDESDNTDDVKPNNTDNIKVLDYKELIINDDLMNIVKDITIDSDILTYDKGNVKYVSPQDSIDYVEYKMKSEDIALAEELNSDRIEGKYEGGLKIWECTEDLADYIINPNIDFKDALTLDLGCGLGLLGIIALQRGSRVHFQDYNEEVITAAVIPNISVNTTEESLGRDLGRCRFFAGDWSYFLSNSNISAEYDYILSSETIYNPKHYRIICDIIKKCLKKSGQALIAAKAYYFGVGGNMREFERYIKDDGVLKCEISWRSDNGVSREIMKVYF